MQNVLEQFIDIGCYPPGYGYNGRTHQTIEVYSPGVCPVGYTTASDTIDGSGNTLAVCCQRYTKCWFMLDGSFG